MPIYEYHCTACGHAFEVIQKFSDEPVVECPECNKKSVEKIVSAPAFHLKGTGWYATDFKDKGKPKEASSDKPSKSNDKPKSDAKPSTKDESGKK